MVNKSSWPCIIVITGYLGLGYTFPTVIPTLRLVGIQLPLIRHLQAIQHGPHLKTHHEPGLWRFWRPGWITWCTYIYIYIYIYIYVYIHIYIYHTDTSTDDRCMIWYKQICLCMLLYTIIVTPYVLVKKKRTSSPP